ncbi:plastocyanin/azurin family copper-binding protein [Cohnella ginsengisoli]|uniref:Plastocyanin/azurin family copper-binding protein n=1 Tax=Cohnella ginsengisoli TaxID=425004 RepID=A0A9X4KNY5_9BACL|nr:plastocyanin/azurin family copper-binding protein [Cohnella ginsengisoli]MDG0795301.1 plastocyanin/azurin family copper-binding protein [Cohnella ginsengisoli]
MRSLLAALLVAVMLALSACGASSDNAAGTEGAHAAHSASAAAQTQTASASADDDAQPTASTQASAQAQTAESTPTASPEPANATPKPTATPQAQHSGEADDGGGHSGGTDDSGSHASASHKPSPSADAVKTASSRPSSGTKGTPSPSPKPSPSASAQDDKHGGKGGGDDEKPAAKTYVVEISDFSFTVEKLEIHPGDSVKFVNRDKVKHTATADDGSFDTGLLGQDESKTVVFENEGEFGYYCTPHPGMRATIVVKAD